MVQPISKELAQQIVDTVKGVCGHNINFIDRNGYILASTDPARISVFHEIGGKVAASGKAIEVFQSDCFAGTRQGINLPIFHNRVCVAVVGISGNPDEVRPFGMLAVRITALLIREQMLNSIASTQAEQRSYILNAYLRQEIKDQQYLDELLKQFQIDTKSQKRIVLVRLLSSLTPSQIRSVEQHAAELNQSLEAKLYMRQYPSDLLIVIENSMQKRCLRLLREFAQAHNDQIRIGIGKASDLVNLSTSYDSARIAVKSVSDSLCPIALFDDLTLDLILSSLSWNRKQEYLKKTIDKLETEDIHLLKYYYQSNMSILQTAKEFFLHKNTIQYRLNRIHEITGLNPRIFQDAVLLYLALCLKDEASAFRAP